LKFKNFLLINGLIVARKNKTNAMLKSNLSLLFILSFFFNAFSASSDSLNILFIGNSYTHMNVMPKIFEKLCKDKGKPVYVQMNTRAGASFSVHVTRTDMFEAIRSRKWDYVILQGYSREFALGYDKVDKETLPYLNSIVDSVKSYNPCTNVLFYLTWGYKNGYSEIPEIDTYDEMASNIINGYTYVSTCYDFPIVPVGIVWKNVRTKFPDINLYDADEQHPNKNGSYLSACTFYAAIFKESPEGAITSTIDGKTAAIIQREAGNYVLSNLESLGLNKNYFQILSERTNTGKFKLMLNANYSHLATYRWDLGNGVVKTDKNVVYYYKNPGKYKVKLIVNDLCGERVYTRTVKFDAIPKPLSKKNSKPSKKGKVQRKN
jgi:hypothetical protein